MEASHAIARTHLVKALAPSALLSTLPLLPSSCCRHSWSQDLRERTYKMASMLAAGSRMTMRMPVVCVFKLYHQQSMWANPGLKHNSGLQAPFSSRSSTFVAAPLAPCRPAAAVGSYGCKDKAGVRGPRRPVDVGAESHGKIIGWMCQCEHGSFYAVVQRLLYCSVSSRAMLPAGRPLHHSSCCRGKAEDQEGEH